MSEQNLDYSSSNSQLICSSDKPASANNGMETEVLCQPVYAINAPSSNSAGVSSAIPPLLLGKHNHKEEQHILPSPPAQWGAAVSGGSSNVSMRKKRYFMPDERKDDKYWEKRKRNNAAARRSREKRKICDTSMEQKIQQLMEENARLSSALETVQKQYGIVIPISKSVPVVSNQSNVSKSASAVVHGDFSNDADLQNSTGVDSGLEINENTLTGTSYLHTLAAAAEVASAYKENKACKTSSDSGLDVGRTTSNLNKNMSSVESNSNDNLSIHGSSSSSNEIRRSHSDETTPKDTRSESRSSQDDSERQAKRMNELRSLPHKLRYKRDATWISDTSSTTSSGSPENVVQQAETEQTSSKHETSETEHDTSPTDNTLTVPVGFINPTSRAHEKHLKYLEKRIRNNLAARKCRQNRKVATELKMLKSDVLIDENSQLRQELVILRKELLGLKEMIVGYHGINKKNRETSPDTSELLSSTDL